MTKEIDYKKVQELAAQLYTQQEIARIVGFTAEGFCRRKQRDNQLRNALERGHAEAEVSIRSAIFNKAVGSNRDDPKKIGLDGNTTLLIYLDKLFSGGKEPKDRIYPETTSC
jgi:hypothetical protein